MDSFDDSDLVRIALVTQPYTKLTAKYFKETLGATKSRSIRLAQLAKEQGRKMLRTGLGVLPSLRTQRRLVLEQPQDEYSPLDSLISNQLAVSDDAIFEISKINIPIDKTTQSSNINTSVEILQGSQPIDANRKNSEVIRGVEVALFPKARAKSLNCDHKGSFVGMLSTFDPAALETLFQRDPPVEYEESREKLSLPDFIRRILSVNENDQMRILLHGPSSLMPLSLACYKEPAEQSRKCLIVDVDSCIWLGDRWASTLSIELLMYPFPNRNSTLTTTNHLSVPVNGKRMLCSRIPNFHFASFGDNNHSRVHVFLPGLVRKKGSFNVN